MKFYFCERCGKRITDKDIAEGEGRNKKLRGVFCVECAVGVSTMDALPMDDGQAKQLLKEQTQRDRTSAGGPTQAKRRPSGAHDTQNRSSGVHPEVERKPGILPAVVLGGATCLITVLILLVVLGGNSAKEAEKKPRETAKRTNGGRLEELREKTDEKASTPLAQSKTQNPRTPNPSNGTRVESTAVEIVDTEAKADRMPPADGPADRDPGKPKDDEVPARTNEPVVDPEAEAKRIADEREAKRKAAEAAARKAAIGVLDEVLTELVDALRREDLAAVESTAKKARDNPALRPLSEQMDALPTMLVALKEIKREKNEVLKNSIDGKVRTIETRTKRIKGVIRKIEKGTIRVKVEGKINKQTIAYEKPVKISDLTKACHEQLFGRLRPDAPRGWMALAVLRIADKNFKGAGAALKEAAGHALEGPIKRTLAREEGIAREADAEKAWTGIAGRAKGVTMEAQALKVLDEITRFVRTYGTTEYAKATQKQREAIEKRISPFREYTLTLQQGQPIQETGIASYEGSTGVIISGSSHYRNRVHGPSRLITRGPGMGGPNHVLIKFAVVRKERGPLPDELELLKAELHIFKSTHYYSPFLYLRRLTSPWVAGEANWHLAAKDRKWTKPGGDFASEVVDSTGTKENSSHWFTFDVTEILRSMLREGSNHGWIMDARNRGPTSPVHLNAVEYASTMSPKKELRPKLVLKIRCRRFRKR